MSSMSVSPYKTFILLFSQETPDEVQKPFSSVTIHDRTYNLGGESEPLKVTGTSNHDSDYLPGSIADKTKPSNPGIGMVDSFQVCDNF